MQYLCLYFGRELGLKVTQVLSRRELIDPNIRKQYLIKQLVDSGSLDGSLRIPRAVGDIILSASLRGRTVSASVKIDAPAEGKPRTRINWLLRQLREAPPQTRIEALFVGGRLSVSGRLSDVTEDPDRLLPQDRSKEVKHFVVSLVGEMGTKRGGAHASFIGDSIDLLLRFYREIVQQIKPWSLAPAKLPESRDAHDIATQPDSVAEEVARRQTEELRSQEPVVDGSVQDPYSNPS
jgi:hypothetical protein